MTTPPTHADLVARALGALGPEDQAQVDLALAQDAELRRQYEEVAAHLLRYEHLPPAPPAPSLDRLRTALDESDARPDLAILQLQRKPARTRWIAGMTAAAAALLALVLWAPWRDEATPSQAPGLHLVAGSGLSVLRDGKPVPAPTRAEVPLAIGDRLTCSAPAEAKLSDRVRVVLDTGAVLRIEAASESDASDIAEVHVEAGRVWFEVGPGPFRVDLDDARHRRVEVLGTAFEIDAREAHVGIAVAHGKVAVYDPTPDMGRADMVRTVLEAGWGIAPGKLGAERLEGAAGSWFQRPQLTLENRGNWALAKGKPFQLDLRFSNPGQVPVELRGPGAIRTAVWISFEDANGRILGERPVLPTHVTGGEGLLAPGTSAELEPGQSRVLSIEILPPLGSPGAYRCRALYRPEGQPAVLSAPLDLEVR